MDEHRQFLSTPSVRRATSRRFGIAVVGLISIHALREEGDSNLGSEKQHGGQFLSTPSVRRATSPPDDADMLPEISIHALREEGDQPGHGDKSGAVHFYPRPP